jgi:hypothetical protein
MRADCKKAGIFILCLLMAVSMASGKPKNKEKKAHAGEDEPNVSAHVAVGVFLERDRELIRDHYRIDHGDLPPGLAKRNGDLPPGLAKQLRRNGHLPPGLEKRLHPFPVELERRLPPLREGLIRGIIGGNAVIMDNNNRVILDIFAVL